MARPLGSSKPLFASTRSKAVSAASLGRGGVRNRRSAHAPARSGARSAEAANRTFVLIRGRERAAGIAGAPFLSGDLAGGVARDEFVERLQRALARFLVAEEATVV